MASITIKYTCGCGFFTHSLEAATKHSDEKLHTLTVLGEVKAAKRPRTSMVSRELYVHRTAPVDDEASFAGLRARLSR